MTWNQFKVTLELDYQQGVVEKVCITLLNSERSWVIGLMDKIMDYVVGRLLTKRRCSVENLIGSSYDLSGPMISEPTD